MHCYLQWQQPFSQQAGIMLVLSRKVGEAILIGDHIEVTVVRVSHNAVRLGIEAPRGYRIVRDELQEPLEDETAGPPENGLVTRPMGGRLDPSPHPPDNGQ